VPDQAARSAAEKDVRDLYKDEYKERTAEGRRILAGAMLKQADSSDVKSDAASHFVLLRDARNAALEAGDFQRAHAAQAAIVRGYDVDPVDERSDSLDFAFKSFYGDPSDQSLDLEGIDNDNTVSAKAFRSAYQEELALQWLLLADEAAKANKIPVAQKSAAQAMTIATRLGSTDLQNIARDTTNKIESLGQRAKIGDLIKAKLAESPNDPDANLDMGKYLCFVQDDWETGRPYLIKGSDSTLKMLAQRDLDAEKDASTVIGLAGDLWKFSAEATNKLGPIAGKRRAAYWYRHELPDLTGLKKATAQKRIAEFAAESVALDHGAVIDLLSLVDVKTAPKKKEWKWGPDGLYCTEARSSIVVPYTPPEEYDLYLDVIRDTGKDTVSLFFPMARGWTAWTLGGQGNTERGFADANSNWFIRTGRQTGIENKQLYHTVIRVRKDRVTGFIDGEMIADLHSNGRGMKVGDIPSIGDAPGLQLGTAGAAATFNSLVVVEITGQGRILTPTAAASNAK
jgi:hypothetical protein